MSDVSTFVLALHHVDQEHADDAAVVGPGPDEGPESLVYLDPDPASVLRFVRVGSVFGDEVISIILSIDCEQSGCGEPLAQGAAFDVVVHDIDEEPDDVVSVVGVVSDECGYGHAVDVVGDKNVCSGREYSE